MNTDYILHCVHIDTNGHAAVIAPETAANLPVSSGYLWVHLDGGRPEVLDWLTEEKTVDFMATQTLLAADARPRTIMHNDAVLINLRGVNLNPGSKAEDMIGIRFFVSDRRIISVQRRWLKATEDVIKRIETKQNCPKTAGAFIAAFALSLADRMGPTISDLNEQVDALEEKIDDRNAGSSRENLAGVRREAILLRRYLAPQRDALNTLALQDVKWINEGNRLKIRDGADQAARITEELEAIRERCAIVKDQLTDQRAEEMNRNMMILSVVAAIFLPLGLLSGMMGINVGGMPWTEDGNGFWYVTAIIAVIGVVQLVVFKILKWI